MIIGISGSAGSGKDTTAGFLVRDFGFAQIAFADPMKRAVADWFDWDAERLWGPSALRNAVDERYDRGSMIARDASRKDRFLSARHALQFLGTEIGRELYRDVWVEYGLRIAKSLIVNGGVDYIPSKGVVSAARPPIAGVAISDVRFANELVAIRRAGGRLLRIVRPEAGLDGAAAAHRSEAEMASIPDSEFDLIIENTGTLVEFRDAVKLAMRKFGL